MKESNAFTPGGAVAFHEGFGLFRWFLLVILCLVSLIVPLSSLQFNLAIDSSLIAMAAAVVSLLIVKFSAPDIKWIDSDVVNSQKWRFWEIDSIELILVRYFMVFIAAVSSLLVFVPYVFSLMKFN